ncbi:ATP-binding response regulator [Methylomonas sp. MS20]|uniref:ATP-binding response regulator n=1 Tax=Methylomonas sp. MS20 TaxID=3418769 RepID=UPI003D051468
MQKFNHYQNLANLAFFRAPARPGFSAVFKACCDAVSAGHLFAFPKFDTASEQEFWLERYQVLLAPLKWALLLGASAFLAYILLDLHTGADSIANALPRMPIVAVLIGLFAYLQTHGDAVRQINTIAKWSAGLSAANLLILFLIDGKAADYPSTWPCLLPMYFFSYGQMFMSLRATIGFGWSTSIAMPLAGHLLGVGAADLISSMINLIIVNLFGVCTRCQLEAYARKSFREKRNAQQNADDKARFLEQIGHNLRQPLQALNCYASVMETACSEPAQAHLSPLANRMGLAIDELSRTINHIFQIANVENGKQIPQLANVDINVFLAGLETQFAPQAAARGLRLKVRLRRKAPYNVYTDYTILAQIVGNLIDNAIKYTRTGWISVTAVNIGAGRLKLHIRDSGSGIPAELRDKIFEDAVRGKLGRENDAKTQGLGIGLYYASTMIQHLPNHGMDLYSRPGVGSDFQVYLPVARQQDIKANEPPVVGDFSGRYVLIVDDDAKALDGLACQLQSWGCEVQTASSLADTQMTLADNLAIPDLLITDFYLKQHETAHDIIAAVQADCGPVPILILSAGGISAPDKARWPANTGLLRKPANPQALMEAMLRTMGDAPDQPSYCPLPAYQTQSLAQTA